MAQFLTPKSVCNKIALSRASLDRMVAANKFPRPIRLTERRIAFNASDVENWMNEKLGAAA